MRNVVFEPHAEYKIAGWQKESIGLSFDEFICGIENGTILFCPQSGSRYIIVSEKPKMKLSVLRGKLSKQSNKEIEDQISDLRNEWDRNI